MNSKQDLDKEKEVISIEITLNKNPPSIYYLGFITSIFLFLSHFVNYLTNNEGNNGIITFISFLSCLLLIIHSSFIGLLDTCIIFKNESIKYSISIFKYIGIIAFGFIQFVCLDYSTELNKVYVFILTFVFLVLNTLYGFSRGAIVAINILKDTVRINSHFEEYIQNIRTINKYHEGKSRLEKLKGKLNNRYVTFIPIQVEYLIIDKGNRVFTVPFF